MKSTFDDADGKLEAIYAELIEKRGKVSNILKVHSLNPEAMADHLDLYMTVMFGTSGLSRAEREAVAVVVSATNDCPYCVNHHAEALRRYIKDEEVLEIADVGGRPRNARAAAQQYRQARREADLGAIGHDRE